MTAFLLTLIGVVAVAAVVTTAAVAIMWPTPKRRADQEKRCDK